jgi:XTP/dITP diphosphohydrolase
MDSNEPSGLIVVLASRNRKKREEMASLLSPPWEPNPRLSGLVIRTLDDFPAAPEVVEDGATFADNARKKATETALALRQWVVADDSGLAVDALGGAPGVHSARYAGGHGDDAGNNRLLLERLADAPDERRGAAFVCAVCLCDPSGAPRFGTEARCRGRITLEPRGAGGFGYDPLFLIREYHRTFGELGPLVKHQISHRARAFARLRPVIEQVVLGYWRA